ncbi:4Fe-4S dicluster domain-containing protein [Desulfitispora alkaliphila]|uniref:4Fe-4S dicluster domain-containing protein n=1 Tax=Desulfitispora alkaliphila TaxID=622674 RepID=UPI003D200D8F
MLGQILKNTFSPPATRLYPFEQREQFPDVRGELEIIADTCILCGICQRKCPTGCIEVDKANSSWKINPYNCILCGSCVEICPKDSLYMKPQWRKPTNTKKIHEEHVEPKRKSATAGR